MKFNISKILASTTFVAGAIAILASCNKDLTKPTPIMQAEPAGKSLTDTIAGDASLAIFRAAINRAATNTTFGPSLSSLFSDRTASFTVFAPTDAAFQLSGIPSVAAVNTLRPGFLDTVLRYHVVGGQRITSAAIPTTFPNIQLPTQLVLAPPSAAIPPGLRMSIFPSRRGNSAWANNIPLTAVDISVANGVIHKTAALVAPPTTTIKGLLAANQAKYSILLAAIQRADSGQVAGLNRLDSAINFAAANLTLFAPNNDAFRALFPPGTPDAAIIGALNTHALFPVQTVRAIIAYHLLGVRAFSVNFAAGPAPVNTQLVIPPGTTPVPVFVTFNGTTIFNVRSVAPNATDANVVTRDQHAVNGVVHEINQVLRPQ